MYRGCLKVRNMSAGLLFSLQSVYQSLSPFVRDLRAVESNIVLWFFFSCQTEHVTPACWVSSSRSQPPRWLLWRRRTKQLWWSSAQRNPSWRPHTSSGGTPRASWGSLYLSCAFSTRGRTTVPGNIWNNITSTCHSFIPLDLSFSNLLSAAS